MKCGLALLACALLAAGCSSSATRGSPVVPDKVLRLTPTTSWSMANVASAALALAVIHVVYDPLAPNWEIEETRLDEETFRLSMRMKRYNTGGAGESMQILKRRAQQLQGELGYGSYHLVEFSEGIESHTLGAQRVAQGLVRLANRPGTDSFLQNAR